MFFEWLTCFTSFDVWLVLFLSCLHLLHIFSLLKIHVFLHLDTFLILVSTPLGTFWYLSLLLNDFWGFFSIPLNTTPIYRANFPNLLFAQYLLDTFLDTLSFYSWYLSIPSQSIEVTDSIYRRGSTQFHSYSNILIYLR